jgi:hypothetical protein
MSQNCSLQKREMCDKLTNGKRQAVKFHLRLTSWKTENEEVTIALLCQITQCKERWKPPQKVNIAKPGSFLSSRTCYSFSPSISIMFTYHWAAECHVKHLIAAIILVLRLISVTVNALQQSSFGITDENNKYFHKFAIQCLFLHFRKTTISHLCRDHGINSGI